MREAGFGLKAATITPEGKDDVGSPNRILREEVDGKVIVRTGRRIPGVVGPVSGVHHPISVVRMAVEDAYGAKQWREGDEGADDEQAFRTEKVTRSTCRAVAEYAFRTAERMGGETRVYGGPKWTVSPVYEGMLKEELDAAAERHPDVPYLPGADRRDLRGPADRRDRDAAGDPGAQPRRRLPVGPRAADVRLDRGRRVDPAGLRRRLRGRRRDGRGPARHRAVADGQGPREPDGDAARLRRAAAVRGAARASTAPSGPRARSTRACSRRPPAASRRSTSAATPRPRSSPTRWSRRSAPRSTSGRRSARAELTPARGSSRRRRRGAGRAARWMCERRRCRRRRIAREVDRRAAPIEPRKFSQSR